MANKVVFYIKESWLLLVCSLVFGLLLATTNAAWKGRIEANAKAKLNNAMKSLFTTADERAAETDEKKIDITFTEVTETEPAVIYTTADRNPKKTAKSRIFKVVRAGKLTGWAFTATGAGFADKIDLVIGVDAELNELTGYDVLFSNETPGFGDKIKKEFFKSQFAAAPAKKLELSKSGDAKVIDDEIIAITGATISSNAVVDTLNMYIDQIKEYIGQKGSE